MTKQLKLLQRKKTRHISLKMKKRITRAEEMVKTMRKGMKKRKRMKKKKGVRKKVMRKKKVVRKFHWLSLLFCQYKEKHQKRNALLLNSAL